ncbi:MAG: hypothetical protein QM736_08460 [Vicinamibacterales bacterium]
MSPGTSNVIDSTSSVATLRQPSTGGVAQDDRAHGQDDLQRVLERRAHLTGLSPGTQRTPHHRQHITDSASSIALPPRTHDTVCLSVSHMHRVVS